MSSLSTSSTSDAQQLIDLRLDAIDRALLGLLPRGERLEVVGKVESRLRELAPTIIADEASRTSAAGDASVDAALASAAMTSGTQRPGSASGWTNLLRRRPRSRLAVASGVLGIVALALLFMSPIVYVLLGMLDSEESILITLLGTHLTSVVLGGFLAVVLGIAALVVINRRDGQLVGHGWAITGLCTGPMPILVGGLAMLVVCSELLDSSLLDSSVVTVETTGTVPAPNLSYPVPVGNAQGMPPAAPCAPYVAYPATESAQGMPPAPACAAPTGYYAPGGGVVAVPSSYDAPAPELPPSPAVAEAPTAKDVESGPVPEIAQVPTPLFGTEAGAVPTLSEPMPEVPADPSAEAP
jgi:hypothetical protein